MPDIDWSAVQEIHAIKKQGGKIDQADITVNGKGEVIVRREYKMPDGHTRVMKNHYKEGETELNADLFMLEVESK